MNSPGNLSWALSCGLPALLPRLHGPTDVAEQLGQPPEPPQAVALVPIRTPASDLSLTLKSRFGIFLKIRSGDLISCLELLCIMWLALQADTA